MTLGVVQVSQAMEKQEQLEQIIEQLQLELLEKEQLQSEDRSFVRSHPEQVTQVIMPGSVHTGGHHLESRVALVPPVKCSVLLVPERARQPAQVSQCSMEIRGLHIPDREHGPVHSKILPNFEPQASSKGSFVIEDLISHSTYNGACTSRSAPAERAVGKVPAGGGKGERQMWRPGPALKDQGFSSAIRAISHLGGGGMACHVTIVTITVQPCAHCQQVRDAQNLVVLGRPHCRQTLSSVQTLPSKPSGRKGGFRITCSRGGALQSSERQLTNVTVTQILRLWSVCRTQ